MFKKSLVYVKFIVLLLTAVLVGCGSIANMNPNYGYQLDSTGKKGLVAFSSRCDMLAGDLSLSARHYLDASKQKSQDRTSYDIFIPCVSPGDDMISKITYAELPVGGYLVDSYWGSNFSQEITARKLHYIAFWVQPNRVNYLGQINFMRGYGNSVEQEIADKSTKDLPVIRTQLSSVPYDAIKIKFAQITRKAFSAQEE